MSQGTMLYYFERVPIYEKSCLADRCLFLYPDHLFDLLQNCIVPSIIAKQPSFPHFNCMGAFNIVPLFLRISC